MVRGDALGVPTLSVSTGKPQSHPLLGKEPQIVNQDQDTCIFRKQDKTQNGGPGQRAQNEPGRLREGLGEGRGWRARAWEKEGLHEHSMCLSLSLRPLQACLEEVKKMKVECQTLTSFPRGARPLPSPGMARTFPIRFQSFLSPEACSSRPVVLRPAGHDSFGSRTSAMLHIWYLYYQSQQ